MNGILPLYKPTGMTSHDCVAKLRTLTKQKKIGHTGTLDPGAEGVLPICFGKATKVVQYMANDQKIYEAEITLGAATTTEDQYGEVIAEKNIGHSISRKQIIDVLTKWIGSITQIPPMYSAVKINGKRLYEYAREGIEVERPERHVTIFELELLDDRETFYGGRVSFSIRVRCSKGTYIRTLAVDIGKSLGYPAHMSSLIRTASGAFALKECLTFPEVEKAVKNQVLRDKLYPIDQALTAFEKLVVDNDTAKKIQNGSVLPLPEEMQENRFTVYNGEGVLLAVYCPHPTKSGMMKPEKVFN